MCKNFGPYLELCRNMSVLCSHLVDWLFNKIQSAASITYRGPAFQVHIKSSYESQYPIIIKILFLSKASVDIKTWPKVHTVAYSVNENMSPMFLKS